MFGFTRIIFNKLRSYHMSQPTTETDLYLYVIHGYIPEFPPPVAYRRAKHFDTEKRKIIKCPYCRGTLTTVEEWVKVELYKHSAKAKVVHTKTLPCKTCHNTVGIHFPTMKSA